MDSKFFNKIIVQGNAFTITIARRKGSTVDEWLSAQKKLLDNVLVFVQCNVCKRNVPKIDMMIQGMCCFCYHEVARLETLEK